jgi:hypothetical protein
VLALKTDPEAIAPGLTLSDLRHARPPARAN